MVVAVTDDLDQALQRRRPGPRRLRGLGGQGGGGRPDMAQAGGPDATKAPDAIAAVKAAMEAA